MWKKCGCKISKCKEKGDLNVVDVVKGTLLEVVSVSNMKQAVRVRGDK